MKRYNINKDGYYTTTVKRQQKLLHRVIAEQALGVKLPRTVIVHHNNEDKLDNRNENLIICQDEAYHQLLHMRKRALEACGNVLWRPCEYCKKHDALENMIGHTRSGVKRKIYTSFFHRICRNAYEVARKNMNGVKNV